MRGWLSRLLGTETVASNPTRTFAAPKYAGQAPSLPLQPSSIPTHPAHLALLAKFRHPGDPANVDKDYWNDVLPEPVGASLALFRANGWLIDAPWQEVFAARYRVDELKGLLRGRGLRVSDKKGEQVPRLIEADADGMRELLAGLKAWVLSPAAAGPVERHLRAEKAGGRHGRSAILQDSDSGHVDYSKKQGRLCAVSCGRLPTMNLALHVIEAGFGPVNVGTFCPAFHPSFLAA